MKRILITLLIGMFLFNIVSADGDIGIVKQWDCIDLYNYCPTCTYINLTAIQYPNQTISLMNLVMVKTNNNYVYNFCDTGELGGYSYTTCGDKATVLTCEDMTFESTPSGSLMKDGDSLVIFGSLAVMIILSSVFLFLASKSENLAAKITLYSISFIGFLMSILYTVVTIQQVLFGYKNIVSGIETFLFVVKIGVGLGVIALFIIILLIMLKAWKIKRGFDD